jgi:hypothetical protein
MQIRPAGGEGLYLEGRRPPSGPLHGCVNLTGANNLRFDSRAVSLFGNAGSPVYSAGMPLFALGVAQLGGPREVQFTVRLVGF